MWNMENASPDREKGLAMKKTLALILAVAMVATCLTGCSLFMKQPEPEPAADAQAAEIEKIEQLAARCRTACNEMDVQGILDCLTPSVAAPLRSMLKLAGNLTDTAEDQVMELLCTSLNADSSDYRAFCQSLRTELSEIEVDGDKATARLTYTYEQDGQSYQGKADAAFVRTDGVWYISKLQGR